MKVALDHARGFDFHCHVDLDRDPARLISQCEGERIVTVAVTTTPKAWAQNHKWTARSGYVRAAVGLHPELVGERYGWTEVRSTRTITAGSARCSDACFARRKRSEGGCSRSIVEGQQTT